MFANCVSKIDSYTKKPKLLSSKTKGAELIGVKHPLNAVPCKMARAAVPRPSRELDYAEIGMAKVLDICGLQHLLEQLLNHAVNRAPFAFHLVDMVPAVNSPYPACTAWKTEFADEIVNCLTPLISGQDVIAKISNSRIAVIQKEHLGQRGADALAV